MQGFWGYSGLPWALWAGFGFGPQKGAHRLSEALSVCFGGLEGGFVGGKGLRGPLSALDSSRSLNY